MKDNREGEDCAPCGKLFGEIKYVIKCHGQWTIGVAFLFSTLPITDLVI
jgi:hypothetical protein